MGIDLISDRSDWKAILTIRNLFLYILCMALSAVNVYIIFADAFANFLISASFGFISQSIVAVVFIYLMIFKPLRDKRRSQEKKASGHL